MRLVDSILNKFTIYIVVYAALFVIFIYAFIGSIIGTIFYSPISLLSSFAVLSLSCFLINFAFARIFRAPINWGSSFVTAGILFFVMMPLSNISDLWVYIFASVLAMGSKYILAINKRHIFNPAAFALMVIGILGLPQINWWVGNSYLLPVVLITGLLVVRKVRKLVMFSTYYIFGIATIGFFSAINNREVTGVIADAVLSYPILFLGTYMLIEPLTTPPRRNTQTIYAILVGILQGAQYNIGFVYSTPELGLIIGNVYSYLVGFRKRLVLRLKEKKQLSSSIYEFSFAKDKKFNFIPGQYFEWTLPHWPMDLRGVRRYFTIASSPTEEDVKIGIKIDLAKASSFKKSLLNLKTGDKIYAGELAGDFTLPKNGKYIFMAGGIGITPFRSIIKYALDKGEKLDAILFYSSSDEKDFVYSDIFESAVSIGLKTFYVCSHPGSNWKGLSGRVDAEMIKKEVPDYDERRAFLSGPNSMVESYKNILRSIGIKPNKIVTDYFPGF